MWRIKTKQPRLKFRNLFLWMFRTSIALRKRFDLIGISVKHLHHALPELQRLFDALTQARGGGFGQCDAINYQFDVVLEALFELRKFVQRIHHAINPNARIAETTILLGNVCKFTFFTTDDRREQQHPLAVILL